MRVAIDVGCWPGGGDSIGHLIRELEVDRVYGFDPHPETPEFAGELIDGALVWTFRQAAHDHDGMIGWRKSGYGSYTTREARAPQVPTIDLAVFLEELIEGTVKWPEPITWLAVKLDCEGDEFPILRHLTDIDNTGMGVIHSIDLLWVEWHGNDGARKELTKWIAENTKCEMAEWTM